jgi:hypothetical protein
MHKLDNTIKAAALKAAEEEVRELLSRSRHPHFAELLNVGQAPGSGVRRRGVRTQGLWTLGSVIVGKKAYLAAAWWDHLRTSSPEHLTYSVWQHRVQLISS